MRKLAYFLLLLNVLFSCKPEEKKQEDLLFTLMPHSVTQVDFVNQLKETEDFNIIEYLYFNNGAGVAAGDINNDGLIDLYFTSNQQSNKLYLNKGNFNFEDITEKAGVAGLGNWTTGVTMADVNGDNLLDIYVCNVGNHKSFQGKNQLFINQGDFTFKDEADSYGLDFEGFSTQAAFFDYDMDGDLDMYLLNHSIHTSNSYGGALLRLEHDEQAGDRLYRNDAVNGKRFFTDVASISGIYNSHIGYGLGVNICDINNDCFPDIYVSNDFHENDYLYINRGDGTFSEKLTDMMQHTSRSSMGNDIGDFNNDGLLDVIVLDMLPDDEKILKQSGGEDDYELFQLKLKYGYFYQFVRNSLQLNLGEGKFSEIGRLAGIYATDWSWSPLFCDVDNDGWKDIFITNGIYRRPNDLDYIKFLTGGNRYFSEKDNSRYSDRELYEKMPLYPNINYIYKNNRDFTFSNKAKEWGFNIRSYSNGSTYADLDNDGDLDLITNNINTPAFIYRNNADLLIKNHFLTVKLIGSKLNTRGIGTRVTLFSNGEKQVAEQFATRGFLSATSDVLHFGVGQISKIDSIVVRWPDQSEHLMKNVSVDQTVVLDIKNAIKDKHSNYREKESKKLFVSTIIQGIQNRHTEDPYTDFEREQLIPHSLSGEGPSLAVGDVNSDNLDDLFVGGSAGQPASLYIQQRDAGFKEITVDVLNHDRYTEDIDAVFFDADNDGDNDLYLVRGGNEVAAGNPLLADRLLFNDGKGGFGRVTGALPYMALNGSCVRPGDVDGDGDLDLFVGSRSVPVAYGLSPNQFLLENNGKGVFTDVTDTKLKGPKSVGMVTDARWIDYDLDGDLDLAMVGEWMKVTLYENDKGYLTDITEIAGLNETSGWWNCIEVADVDNDGDMDLIGGNLGLNSILKASVNQPLQMYINDFDKNGVIEQVICSYQKGISYPVASLDQLAAKISGLEKKYPKYSDFGEKSVTDIFGMDLVEQSILRKAVLLKSSLFLNNGDGTFETIELPQTAQFSPIRDILAADFDLDGNKDLITIGNDYVVNPSYGRYDASFGWCLLGDEKNHKFKTLMPEESGFAVIGDARKIRIINIFGKPHIVVAVNNGDLQLFQLIR